MKTALIIGGGIGGLCVALQLHKQGITPHVFEAATTLEPLGVGITVQAYAVKELEKINLVEQLKAYAVICSQMEYRSQDGTLIFTREINTASSKKAPVLSIHRGHLHQVLLDEFCRVVGNDNLHLGHRFTQYKMSENQVVVECLDRKTNKIVSHHGDLLIGADGIHSMVRQQLHPNEGGFHFSGVRMWRGTTYQKPYADGKCVILAGDPEMQMIIYPISQKDINGSALINWVVLLKDPRPSQLSDIHWNKAVSPDDIIHHFSAWQFDQYNLQGLIHHANRIVEYPMVDRDPLDAWGQGCVTLLGDAAHPMYPRGGQGASQAIVDAACLAEALSTIEEIPLALQTYEKQRLPITSDIVKKNRKHSQLVLFELVKQACNGQCQGVHQCVDLEQMKQLFA